MTTPTNIIDKPRKGGSRDMLGTDKYMEALNRFIMSANMPTTIAIQGEWGSGKTSMINQIRFKLCESDENPNAPFYGVWLNTWQYSLMKSPDEALVSIIEGLTEIILSLIQKKHKTKAQQLTNKLTGALKVFGKAAAKTAISQTGLDGDSIVDELASGPASKTVLGLRDSLESAIAECLELDRSIGSPRKGFIFFIDDLDRIDPPVAVQILELIKNIFEVENCLFVIAIDYEVVVKGLVPKFGPLTEKNEREFRSFFDKIIQMPFSMPVGAYKVNDFLIESLLEVNYLDATLGADEDYKHDITQMATSSVGTNPRSLKRLINTLSLIQIMNELEEGAFGESRMEKLINFGLVCLQIAYPTLYTVVSDHPAFIEWDEKLANKLRLPELTDEEVKILETTDEFDEPWEKVVYRFAVRDMYLKNKAFNISTLLNHIKDAVPRGSSFGDTIESALTLSSVTSVTVAPSSKKPFEKVRFDTWETFRSNQIAKGIPEENMQFIEQHRNDIEKMCASNNLVVEYVYTPNEFGFQLKLPLKNKRKFLAIQPKKKGFGTWMPAQTSRMSVSQATDINAEYLQVIEESIREIVARAATEKST
jgi:hypothetical protein